MIVAIIGGVFLLKQSKVKADNDYSSDNSGKPAMDVSRDNTPANRAALPTIIQFTSSITAAVPMVAQEAKDAYNEYLQEIGKERML